MADALPFILILSITLLIYYFSRRSALPKPPGPRGWPILGNIFENPVSHKQRKYKEWGDKYGPIVRYSLFTDEIIVLNTRETATELLEKRSASSQDRPRQIMCGELMNWNKAMGLSRAGYQHRTYRKLVGGVLSPTAVRNLFPVEERAARLFVHDLLRQCSAGFDGEKRRPDQALAVAQTKRWQECCRNHFGADFAPEGRTGQGLTLEEV
ncbi:hypothetical protein D9758_017993 [Tetrapyrgos nigripes]|uniref:Cytochrome P450 n=1 Tax=Tetrapyrgos nigripes TaxID=182062 RepID=A0A8H5B5B6_9AGAR|nr:hypothetical protein D9758_017993 [Tetrapyrgos nigripes]